MTKARLGDESGGGSVAVCTVESPELYDEKGAGFHVEKDGCNT